jgi:eukaryotic-like serine/threonine-protein kinase
MLSPIELITFLTRFQFLSPAQGEVLSRERNRFVSSVQLCGELVQKGWLTPYQQAQLLSGNGEKLKIGSYRVQAPLGEGGMGMVFKAIQPKLDRVVALKVIRPQVLAARPEILSRFQREARAIAQLNHPNVVILFDADEVDGTHFIAMEYVEGPTLEKMVRTQGPLSIKQACEYIRQSALGLQHAYECGLVHRDIKPSNILVTLYDGKPVPKVIDFGVAKATEQKLTERSLFTQYGTMVGTFEYMSPEQAEMSALGVDTRSDIFSLGVLLYELLTGSTPLTHKRMKEAAYADILRMIKEEEPPKPSTRLSDSGEALASISANRHTEPAKLTKLVRGELDWIVMKTLEKDRNRRYETAKDFAADVQRYLNDETVQACPPSAGYKIRKLLRRHWRPVLAASLVILALIGGVIGATWGLIRAEAAAEAERHAKDVAERRLAQIEKGNDLLTSIFNDLDPDAETKEGRPLRVILGERLDKATSQLDGEAIGDPLTVAKLQYTLGVTQLGLGYPDKAMQLFEKARRIQLEFLGPDHPDILWTQYNLALAFRDAGHLDKAIPLFQLTLDAQKAKLGDDHPATLWTQYNLARAYRNASQLDKAIPLQEQTLKARKARLGDDHPATLWSRHDLAGAYLDACQPGKAILLLEQNLKGWKAKLGEDHRTTLSTQHRLAQAYQGAGQVDKAIPLLTQTLKAQRAKLGDNHPDTLWSQHSLARAYRIVGQLDEAIPLLEQTLKAWKRNRGDDHPATHTARSSLAAAYQAAGKLDQALSIFEETLKLRQTKLGADHPNTLESMNNLAWLLATSVDPKIHDGPRALALAQKAVGLVPRAGNNWRTLGVAHYRARDWKAALDALTKAMELRQGGNSSDWFFLAMAHWQLGDKEAASKWYDQAVVWMDKNQPKNEELRRFREEAAELLGVKEQD